MTLTQGVPYLAIPGPSVIPEAVLRAMHRSSPNIYEGELVDLTKSLVPDLKWIAGTEHSVAMYIGNGHAAWEAALSNILSPGDRVLVPVTGAFARFWADMADGLGVEAQLEVFPEGQPIDPDRIEAILRADTAGQIKAVLAVHTDTSTGVRSDMAQLSAAIRAAGHDALLCVDCIASMGCDPFEMDAMGVDLALSACQKGLMTPAGMSFVWFGPRAAAARDRQARVSRYWDWQPRVAPEHLAQFFDGTAPTHHLYGLRTAMDMLREEGLEAVWHRHHVMARAVWAAVDAWGAGGDMALCVPDAAYRSHAITAIHLPNGGALRLQDWCRDQIGLTLGIGLGRDPREDYFRIGHMGHVNGQMMMAALGGIQAGLVALDIPHGTGAVDAAARVIAEG